MVQKILPPGGIVIFADNREAMSDVVSALHEMDCVVKLKTLKIADYILSDRVGVERKTFRDFLQSIMDKRLFSQLGDLQKSFPKPLLIIEGFPPGGLHDHERGMHPNALRGAFASVVLDYNIPIMWSDSPEETAQLLFWVAKREQIDEERSVAIRGKRREMTDKDFQEYIIAGLPNIDKKKAQYLLRHFGSVDAVFHASEDELQEVAGIGKILARRIKEIIEKEYED